MKSLLIGPGYAMNPNSGGGQRTRLLFDALNEFSEVDLLPTGMVALPLHSELYPEAGAIHDGLFDLPDPLGLISMIGRVNPILARLIKRLVVSRRAHFTPDAEARRSMAQIDLGAYDLIVGRYLEPISKMGVLGMEGICPVLVDIDDRDDTKMLNMARNKSGGLAKRFYAKRLHAQLKTIFAEKAGQADHLWLASEGDLHGISHHSMSVLPNIPFLDLSATYDPRGAETQGRILFVGAADHIPNLEGLRAFIRTAWPKVRRVEPEARLRVVGAGWSEDIAGGAAADGVDVLGFVDDLEEEYARASLVVAPVMEGGGTKIKVLEAMKFQKAVVSHRHSANGFKSTTDATILRSCDTIKAMADACISLLSDAAARQALIDAGQDYVLANHSREMFFHRVRQDCEAALNR